MHARNEGCHLAALDCRLGSRQVQLARLLLALHQTGGWAGTYVGQLTLNPKPSVEGTNERAGRQASGSIFLQRQAQSGDARHTGPTTACLERRQVGAAGHQKLSHDHVLPAGPIIHGDKG